ncbi:hypothetical protein BDS110ZK4_24180 [Bradyrhizobium diazoefficiens]|uniref:DUF2158 domain-containing protein n=1 Tax=Bradyrhizobium diazoefficiens TaxID=1355477 RepID=A0A809X569_9BRAD|nr:hypothetical protein XF1B_51770 [Bradyrhizobium diazoefficiens]BCE48760.1 hypothetical protein XF4B_51090 [Bradyrhizobium diazoefficiens]BCE92275.1 hypothetical protein XF10B_50730 [Bradyrhizobium diazoefficiens]BCF27203.1 hypothetical protein XF14B_51550 [Bradyrhizobium diazoefficiens]
MAEFKIGDIVVLKSGGPRMTVDVVSSDGDVYATWFAGSAHKRAHFSKNSIESAPPKETPKK